MSGATDADGEERRAFERLLEYVEAELAFQTSVYNESYLDRRLRARMRRRDVEAYDAYRALLTEEGEREALLDALSVNVTSFFRNPEVWEALRGPLRTLTEERRRVKIWSAPCSDGREPYSLAMLALDDPGVDADRLEIVGSDIDRTALRAARKGVYETTRTTDLAEQLAPLDDWERYVDRDGDRFTVCDTARDLVTFDRHDLVRGGAREGFDLVCCRNLLIYIDAESKESVLETVRSSLRPGGYLTIGMTETLPRDHRSNLEPADKSRRIYRLEAD